MKKVAFIPSRIKDNPAVDYASYVANLMHLPPVIRERLLAGDWSILPTGLLVPEYFRYYQFRSGNSYIVEMLKTIVKEDGSVIHTDEIINAFDIRSSRRFITIDTAGGVKEVEDTAKNKQLSNTAMGVFDLKRFSAQSQAMFVRHINKGRGWTFNKIVAETKITYENWNQDHPLTISRVGVEDKALGVPLCELLTGKMPIRLISTQGLDKIARAGKMMEMFSKGEIYFPKHNNHWLPGLESELLAIQGMKDETNDQWDIMAYAALEANSNYQRVVAVQDDPRHIQPLQNKFQGQGNQWGF